MIWRKPLENKAKAKFHGVNIKALFCQCRKCSVAHKIPSKVMPDKPTYVKSGECVKLWKFLPDEISLRARKFKKYLRKLEKSQASKLKRSYSFACFQIFWRNPSCVLKLSGKERRLTVAKSKVVTNNQTLTKVSKKLWKISWLIYPNI